MTNGIAMGVKLLESNLAESRTSIGRGTHRLLTSAEFIVADDVGALILLVGVPSLLGTVFLFLYLNRVLIEYRVR